MRMPMRQGVLVLVVEALSHKRQRLGVARRVAGGEDLRAAVECDRAALPVR
jgi:hypothetical protein